MDAEFFLCLLVIPSCRFWGFSSFLLAGLISVLCLCVGQVGSQQVMFSPLPPLLETATLTSVLQVKAVICI